MYICRVYVYRVKFSCIIISQVSWPVAGLTDFINMCTAKCIVQLLLECGLRCAIQYPTLSGPQVASHISISFLRKRNEVNPTILLSSSFFFFFSFLFQYIVCLFVYLYFFNERRSKKKRRNICMLIYMQKKKIKYAQQQQQQGKHKVVLVERKK